MERGIASNQIIKVKKYLFITHNFFYHSVNNARIAYLKKKKNKIKKNNI